MQELRDGVQEFRDCVQEFRDCMQESSGTSSQTACKNRQVRRRGFGGGVTRGRRGEEGAGEKECSLFRISKRLRDLQVREVNGAQRVWGGSDEESEWRKSSAPRRPPALRKRGGADSPNVVRLPDHAQPSWRNRCRASERRCRRQRRQRRLPRRPRRSCRRECSRIMAWFHLKFPPHEKCFLGGFQRTQTPAGDASCTEEAPMRRGWAGPGTLLNADGGTTGRSTFPRRLAPKRAFVPTLVVHVLSSSSRPDNFCCKVDCELAVAL